MAAKYLPDQEARTAVKYPPEQEERMAAKCQRGAKYLLDVDDLSNQGKVNEMK